MKTQDRIQALQALLHTEALAAYVVPSADPHQSEYVAAKWARRQFISGFTGSAGTFAATTQKAGLWTDGRYFEQAEAELKGSGIDLFRQGQAGVPDWQEWMTQTLEKGSRIGINPSLFSIQAFQRITAHFSQAGFSLVPLEGDLVDKVWNEERPELPGNPLYPHPLQHAGEGHEAKLKRLRAALEKAKAASIIISALDELAWLFNLRGADVPCNPVFYAFAIVSLDKATLYTDVKKLSEELQNSLAPAVTLAPYEQFTQAVKLLKGPVWLDPVTSNAAVESILKNQSLSIISEVSPLPTWKAIKNQAELSGMRQAHVRDGLALLRFSRWLKASIGTASLDEISVAEKLEAYRRLAPEYKGPSFFTIAGYGPHGALPHYRATAESNARLKPEGIFLLDSGGQYTDGTTDVTRTFALGQPSDRHRLIYTSVLKGHLLFGRSHFPEGTNGYQLDVLARQPLWKEALDYNHGTGHGVGAALCVHEGPFSVSKRQNLTPLAVGHVLSNEPACYVSGDFGVRIENLVEVLEKVNSPAYGRYLGFEDLTLCPYERELIDRSRLSAEDRLQIDSYHARVFRELSPLVDEADRQYLAEQTRPL